MLTAPSRYFTEEHDICRDQVRGFVAPEIVGGRDHPADRGPLAGVDVEVRARDLDEEHRGGETIGRYGGPFRRALHPSAQSFEHRTNRGCGGRKRERRGTQAEDGKIIH